MTPPCANPVFIGVAEDFEPFGGSPGERDNSSRQRRWWFAAEDVGVRGSRARGSRPAKCHLAPFEVPLPYKRHAVLNQQDFISFQSTPYCQYFLPDFGFTGNNLEFLVIMATFAKLLYFLE